MKVKPSQYVVQLEAGKLRPESGVIPDVVIIQEGYSKGHYCVKENGRLTQPDWSQEYKSGELIPQFIDSKMLQQLCAAITEKQTVKAKVEHGSGVMGTFGDYAQPRVDGDKLRAELTLMKHSIHKDFVSEIFDRYAHDFGNSVDILVTYELGEKNGKEVALLRLKKLNSIDLVDAGAATSALLSEENEPQSQPDKAMPLTPEEKAELSTMIKTTCGEVMAEKLSACGLENLKKDVGAMKLKLEEGAGDDDDAKKKKEKAEKDEEEKMTVLVEKGINRFLASTGRGPIPPGAERGTGSADPWENAIQLAEGAGAKNRGEAIRMAARKHPDLYNKHMAALNAGQRATA